MYLSFIKIKTVRPIFGPTALHFYLSILWFAFPYYFLII
jgi:hypothetical protein